VDVQWVRGHFIEVPCFEIKSKDFRLVFLCKHLLFACVYDDILDDSYFTTTKGTKHNMGENARKNGKKGIRKYVFDHRADDVLHMVECSEDGKYSYTIGYEL